MTEAVNIGFLQKMIKTKSKSEKEEQREMEQLIIQRKRVREELENSFKNYNHVKDKGLMDFYIYKIRSEQVLEQYLIREIRKLESGNKSA